MQAREMDFVEFTPAVPEPVQRQVVVIKLDVKEADALYEMLAKIPYEDVKDWLTDAGRNLRRELQDCIEDFDDGDADPGRGVYYV